MATFDHSNYRQIIIFFLDVYHSLSLQFTEPTPPDNIIAPSCPSPGAHNVLASSVQIQDAGTGLHSGFRPQTDSIAGENSFSAFTSSSSSSSSSTAIIPASNTSLRVPSLLYASSTLSRKDDKMFFDLTGDVDSVEHTNITAPAVSLDPSAVFISRGKSCLDSLFPVPSLLEVPAWQLSSAFSADATTVYSSPSPSLSTPSLLPFTDTSTPDLSSLLHCQSQNGSDTNKMKEDNSEASNTQKSIDVIGDKDEEEMLNEEQNKFSIDMENKDECDLRSLASPIGGVCEFVKSVCRQVFPLKTVWGTRHNLSAFLAAVDRYDKICTSFGLLRIGLQKLQIIRIMKNILTNFIEVIFDDLRVFLESSDYLSITVTDYGKISMIMDLCRFECLNILNLPTCAVISVNISYHSLFYVIEQYHSLPSPWSQTAQSL